MFSNKVILLMVLVPLLQAQYVHSASLNSELKAMFQRLKDWMPYLNCLDPELPVMEPLFIENLDFDIEHEIGKFKGAFKKVTIVNLSKFELNLIKVSPLQRTFEADVSIPKLVIDGEYDIDGNIGELIPLTGKGPVEITIKDINVAVDGKIGLGIPLVMKDLDIKFSISSFKGHFHGLLGDAELEEVFNKLINDIALEALDVLWPEIEVVLTDMIKAEADKMLADMTLADLLNLQNIIKKALPTETLEDCINAAASVYYSLA